MKHSILVTSIGLCMFSFGCGSADNSATAADGAATGPQWLAPVEIGEGGATSGDEDVDDPSSAGDVVGTEAAVQSTSQDLSASGWTIQLPNNTKQAATSDRSPWYTSSGSSKIYSDPVTGTTTKGSKHCRTEMRENSTWKASGTNTMTVTGKVTKASGGGITIGQVFNDNDSIPLAELQYTGSGFEVLYEEAKSQGAMHKLSCSTGLNQSYTFTMSLTKGKLVVSIAGGSSWSTTPTSKVSGHNFYFKVGNYDQGSTGTSSTPVSSAIRSTVQVSSLAVSHK